MGTCTYTYDSETDNLSIVIFVTDPKLFFNFKLDTTLGEN